jgi:hypothetical protein
MGISFHDLSFSVSIGFPTGPEGSEGREMEKPASVHFIVA